MAANDKVIVITGSTRGIGLGMANEFLKRGHRVVISGRGTDSTAKAAAQLQTVYGEQNVFGQACEVGDFNQVQALWDATVARFGRVDIWINNAGIANPTQDFWTLPTETIESVVQTNLVGMMYCCKVVLQGMLAQGFGHLYNMEGLGSSGPVVAGNSVYGATKSGLTSLTRTLVKELENKPVKVSFLSPGMVVTDLLIGDLDVSEGSSSRRIFNILADRVETVAPFLVNGILANTKHGAHISWLTTPKIAWRFMTSPFNKRDVFNSEAAS